MSRLFKSSDVPVESTVVAEKPRRHALGLPAGSVRALLTLGVLGLLWTLALRHEYTNAELTDKKLPPVFVYLLFLMVLSLAHFFAAHGSTIGPRVSRRSPLALPRGSVRFLLIIGYLGLAAYLYHVKPDLTPPPNGPFILLLGLLISGFILGHLLSGFMRVVGRGQLPAWFADFEAWIALLALFGLGLLLIVHLFINPSVSEPYKIDFPTVEAALAAAVGFYFGARS
jgi:hypothetical protein